MLGLFYCCFFFNTWYDRLKRQNSYTIVDTRKMRAPTNIIVKINPAITKVESDPFSKSFFLFFSLCIPTKAARTLLKT